MPTATRHARAVWLLMAVLVAGCGGGRKAPPEPVPTATPKPPTDRELITGLLERRARALSTDRTGAFATTSMPRRGEAARAAARRISGLKLRNPHYRIERVRIRGRTARVHARLSYGVKGVTGDFGSDRVLLARKRDGRWRLDRALGTRNAEPWEVDDYARTRSKHFVVFSPDGIAAPVDALEAGYAQLRQTLEADMKRRYLVVVARDGEHTRRLTQHITGIESLTAITDTQIRVRGRALRVTGVNSQRLIINTPQFLAAPDQTQVIAHELTHAALAPTTSGRVPAWLVEGVALYASADDRRAAYASLPVVPTLAGLSAPDAIARMTGSGQRAAYTTSSAAAFAIADRYGPDALTTLIAAYARPRFRGRRGDPELTDRVLRATLGTTLTALQRSLD